MRLHEYTVYYRNIETQRSSHWAYRVEGWSQDYAFFADADDLRTPSELIPRDIVRQVFRINEDPALDAPEVEL